MTRVTIPSATNLPSPRQGARVRTPLSATLAIAACLAAGGCSSSTAGGGGATGGAGTGGSSNASGGTLGATSIQIGWNGYAAFTQTAGTVTTTAAATGTTWDDDLCFAGTARGLALT